MPKALQLVLHDREDRAQEGEDEGLVERRVDQRFRLEPAAEAEHASDHDHLAEDERFDQRDPVVGVGDVVFRKDEPSVYGEGSKDERQVNNVQSVLG